MLLLVCCVVTTIIVYVSHKLVCSRVCVELRGRGIDEPLYEFVYLQEAGVVVGSR